MDTPTTPFEFNVRHIPDAPGLAVIDLRGQLDAFAGDALDRALEQTGRPHTQAILLNFSGVEYINSTGIALLIGLIMRVSKSGCRLLGCGLNAHYTKIFQMARLSEYISLFADEAAALANVQDSDIQI